MDAAPHFAGAGFALTMLFAGLIALLLTAFWIWMLVDCATNEPAEGNDRIIWILVILFGHGLGAFIYYLAHRPQRMALHGK